MANKRTWTWVWVLLMALCVTIIVAALTYDREHTETPKQMEGKIEDD